MENKKIVTLTVNECSEFHSLGESHENIKTVDAAIRAWERIPAERMHGIKSMGIRVSDFKNPDKYEEMDILTGRIMDLDMIHYYPEIAENKKALEMIRELQEKLINVDIIGSLPDSQKNQEIKGHRR
ncbi:MAG: hypothetical protein PHP50_14390 [Lachnospiraceae bacterium]|nr:hypothetical protein [Lachnospiraceae bacterium]